MDGKLVPADIPHRGERWNVIGEAERIDRSLVAAFEVRSPLDTGAGPPIVTGLQPEQPPLDPGTDPCDHHVAPGDPAEA